MSQEQILIVLTIIFVIFVIYTGYIQMYKSDPVTIEVDKSIMKDEIAKTEISKSIIQKEVAKAAVADAILQTKIVNVAIDESVRSTCLDYVTKYSAIQNISNGTIPAKDMGKFYSYNCLPFEMEAKKIKSDAEAVKAEAMNKSTCISYVQKYKDLPTKVAYNDFDANRWKTRNCDQYSLSAPI